MKHHQRGWGQPLLGEVSGVIDDHTHVMSILERQKVVNEECLQRGLEPIAQLSSEDIINQALRAGISQFIEVGCEFPEWEPTLELVKSHPGRIYAALAIHPNEAPLHGHHGFQGADGEEVHYQPWHEISYEDAFAKLENVVRAHKKEVVAIGESGLDLYRSGLQTMTYQVQSLYDHLQLAEELDLPIQLHVRDAYQQIVEILVKKKTQIPIVFHSFAGDEEIARIAKENGWYLSFSGIVTFKGNDRLKNALALIDKEHILVETDAPYLTPVPYRGRINTPAMCVYTLQEMGKVLGLSTEEMARITAANARKVYRLP